MAGIHEDLVILNQRPISRSIYAGEIRHVVTVLLEPLDHREFRAEQPGIPLLREASGQKWAVVADLKGTTRKIERWRSLPVETAIAVVVVSLPRLVRSLIQDCRMTGIIPHNKNNVAVSTGAVVGADEMSKINT